MENANSLENRKEGSEDRYLKSYPSDGRREYKVLLWTGLAGTGSLDRIERTVRADSRQEAVGMVLMHMKVTDPAIIIQPKGISVYLV